MYTEEEPRTAVAGGSVGEPDAVDLVEGPHISAAPDSSGKESVPVVPVEAAVAMVEGSDVRPAADIAKGGRPACR